MKNKKIREPHKKLRAAKSAEELSAKPNWGRELSDDELETVAGGHQLSFVFGMSSFKLP